VVAGWVLFLTGYGIGGLGAIGASEGNESGWLFAPVVGPWMTLGRRSYSGCDQTDNTNGLGCVGDVFATMGLIVDGVLQLAGVTLLTVGYLAPKRTLVAGPPPPIAFVPSCTPAGCGGLVRGTF
jgi:hypothetical protein